MCHMATRSRINPTLASKQLGAALRALRTRAEVSAATAASWLDCSEQKIWHIESGRNSVAKAELVVLGSGYRATSEEASEMEEMRQAAAKPRWWSTYRFPRWLSDYVGLEDAASRLRAFELELIHGLLQTPDYVRGLYSWLDMTPEQVEQHVAARQERQKRLTDEDPLNLEVVLSESSLRRALAHPQIGPGQIRHLVAMAQLPNVTINVLPTAKGLHRSMSGSFAVMEFVTPPEVGWQEYAVGGHVVDEPAVVKQLHTIWWS
jgi:Domain of unknown function (DUF5753)/Helix-turn-helix domain